MSRRATRFGLRMTKTDPFLSALEFLSRVISVALDQEPRLDQEEAAVLLCAVGQEIRHSACVRTKSPGRRSFPVMGELTLDILGRPD